MLHRSLSIALVISLAIFISCSGSGQMAQQQGSTQATSEVQQYPAWYPNQNIVNTDTVMYAYATAIAGDSAAAVDKAVAWAESELKSKVSNKLENLRSDALMEFGSESGLDESKFMIALRRADNAVGFLAETGRTEVRTVEGYNSYRSFAEILVPKDELIKRIGKRLAGYEQAWNAMKESKAFENF